MESLGAKLLCDISVSPRFVLYNQGWILLQTCQKIQYVIELHFFIKNISLPVVLIQLWGFVVVVVLGFYYFVLFLRTFFFLFCPEDYYFFSTQFCSFIKEISKL